jgi:hypothetical protein
MRNEAVYLMFTSLAITHVPTNPCTNFFIRSWNLGFCSGNSLVGCDAVFSWRNLPDFQRNVLSPFSEENSNPRKQPLNGPEDGSRALNPVYLPMSFTSATPPDVTARAVS